MTRLDQFRHAIEVSIELHGYEVTGLAIIKAIKRLTENPEFFRPIPEGELPRAGNECGPHIPFIGVLYSLMKEEV